MCNRFKQTLTWREYVAGFHEAGLPILRPGPEAAPNLEPRPDVRPTNTVPVVRSVEADDPRLGVELVQLRWGLIPWWHRGGAKDFKFLCTNARSETVTTTRTYKDAFARRRCLVPADGFYEWTGPKGSKTKWLFTSADQPWFCFPGVWERWDSPEGPLETFTIMTTAPGPDAAPYHDRQPVILERDQWAMWLNLTADVSGLLSAGSAGKLKVEQAEKEAALID